MGGIASTGVEAYAKAVVRYVRAPLTEDREALQGLREGVPVEEGK